MGYGQTLCGKEDRTTYSGIPDNLDAGDCASLRRERHAEELYRLAREAEAELSVPMYKWVESMAKNGKLFIAKVARSNQGAARLRQPFIPTAFASTESNALTTLRLRPCAASIRRRMGLQTSKPL